VTCARNWRLVLQRANDTVPLCTIRSYSACYATSSWRAFTRACSSVTCARNWHLFPSAQADATASVQVLRVQKVVPPVSGESSSPTVTSTTLISNIRPMLLGRHTDTSVEDFSRTGILVSRFQRSPFCLRPPRAALRVEADPSLALGFPDFAASALNPERRSYKCPNSRSQENVQIPAGVASKL